MGSLSYIVPRKPKPRWTGIADYAVYSLDKRLIVAPWVMDLRHFVKSEVLDHPMIVINLTGSSMDEFIQRLIQAGSEHGLR